MGNKKDYKMWIPLGLMQDQRTQKLIDETGYKGLGVLLSMIIALEHCYLFSPTPEAIFGIMGGNISLKFKRKILFNYGFFQLNPSGCVESCFRAGVYMYECADERTMQREDERTPLSLVTNNQKDITTEEQKEDATVAAVAMIKEVLLPKNPTLWQQTLQMQCPFRELLSRHWTPAVEFFINHAIAQDKLIDLYNETEIRRYFARYVMGNNAASFRLLTYLQDLDASTAQPAPTPDNPYCFEDPVGPDGSRSYHGGRPIPTDAPPRPSATAEMNDATDEWIEIHP